MIDTLVIDAARPADQPSVQRLVFDTLRSFGIEPEPETVDSPVPTFGLLEDDDVVQLVARVGGDVVGCVALYDRGQGAGHVSTFFVDGAFRGRGIGRALLARIVAEATARGLRRLDLQTRERFEAAIHLYEGTGWVRGAQPAGVCDRTYILTL